MKPETKQTIITLYWNWNRRGRVDYGLPYSLADYLGQIKWNREKPFRLSLEQHAEAVGMPLSFFRELAAALDEGITEEEIAELTKVQSPAKYPDTGERS